MPQQHSRQPRTLRRQDSLNRTVSIIVKCEPDDELTNDNPVPLLHVARILPTKRNLPRAILVMPHPDILTTLAGTTTANTRGCNGSTLTQDRHLDVTAELNVSDTSVPTGVLPLAAGALADGKLMEDAGISLLERLGVRDARVGHVDVHARLSGPCRPGTRATGNGLSGR